MERIMRYEFAEGITIAASTMRAINGGKWWNLCCDDSDGTKDHDESQLHRTLSLEQISAFARYFFAYSRVSCHDLKTRSRAKSNLKRCAPIPVSRVFNKHFIPNYLWTLKRFCKRLTRRHVVKIELTICDYRRWQCTCTNSLIRWSRKSRFPH